MSASRLPCVNATDNTPVRPGTVSMAPPNFHLLLEAGRVHLVPSPRENGHRPAIDPLFRSAAAVYGARVAGVVLTGNLDDGARGLLAITRHGGMAVVQSPDDADFPGMPMSAIANVPVHHVLPAATIGPLLAAVAPRLPSDSAEQNRAAPMPDNPTNGARGNGAGPRHVERVVEHAADLETGIGVVDGGARINYGTAPGTFGSPASPYAWRDRLVPGSRFGPGEESGRGLDGDLRDQAFDAQQPAAEHRATEHRSDGQRRSATGREHEARKALT